MVPFILTVSLERIDLGVAMAVGVLISSPRDVPGDLRRRVEGILIIAHSRFIKRCKPYIAENHPCLALKVGEKEDVVKRLREVQNH